MFHQIFLVNNKIANNLVFGRESTKYEPGTKGQLISKGIFGILNSSKKTNENIQLYYYDTSGRLVFIRFFGRNWRHQKDISKLTNFSSVIKTT